MKTVEILRMAKAWVEFGWTRGADARNNDGKSVSPLSLDAVCWCAVGAMKKVSGTESDLEKGVYALQQTINGYVSSWNDTPGRTQAEVLDLFDRAIEAQKE